MTEYSWAASRLQSCVREKRSNLCVGLDPRRPLDLRPDAPFDRVSNMLHIIEETSDYACAFKVNRQFVLGLTHSELQKVTTAIQVAGCYSMIDQKTSDIGSSNEKAFKMARHEGFEATTVSPLPGNFDENFVTACDLDLDLIYLVFMSNSEAKWWKEARIDGLPLFAWFAREVREKSQGAVVGTTHHVTEDDLLLLRKHLSLGCFILAPGIGAQGGNLVRLTALFGSRVVFSSSRGISTADSPKNAAMGLCAQIGKVMSAT